MASSSRAASESGFRKLSRFASVVALACAAWGCNYQSKPAGDPAKISRAQADLAADMWARQGRTREALVHALKAVDADPQNPDAQHLTALIYLDFCRSSQIGECRLKEAEKHIREAVKYREDFLEAQNTLAVVLIHQKRYTEAQKVLIPITQNMLYATPEIAWGNLGWAYLLEGKNEKAIPALRRAVAAQPLFCVGNFRLGVAYRRAGALESAVNALDRAVETDAPGCDSLQDAYLERAEIFMETEMPDRARADLDTCVSLSKLSPSGRRCSKLLPTVE